MCGITGFWDASGKLTSSKSIAALNKMTNSLAHRGPDGNGLWYSEEHGIYFGHRRLSIYDLSSMGTQPMVSPSQRYVIVFNGSIYNFNQLKCLAPEYTWLSDTDTEVILVLIEKFGIETTIKKLEGMFAIVLWDSVEEKIFLIRDRVGEKPLYFYFQNSTLIFASELTAIKNFPDISLSLDKKAIALQLKMSYIPAPLSVYSNVKKITPGTIFSINKHGDTKCDHYWKLEEIAKQNKNNINISDAKTKFSELFSKTMSQQLIADVSVGTFLSGGTDSSLVCAFSKNINKNINSFTIGIENSSFNEADNAKEVAKILGTTHHELYIKEQDLLDIIPQIPQIYSEPFSDSSQLPTLMVSKLAKQHITVALSGDGADEIFAGYNRHKFLPAILKKTANLPLKIRETISSILLNVPTSSFDSLYSVLRKLNSRKYNHQDIGDKVHKFANVFNKENIESMYNTTVSIWLDPPIINNSTECIKNIPLPDDIDFMLLNDSLTYLPDDILTKVDRASMSVALECRAPFLDHNLINFAWSLPNEIKVNNGQGKYLLKTVLEDYLPKDLIYQPKKGFGIPIGTWLKGPLLPWANSLLSKENIEKYDFLDFRAIQKTWELHKSSKNKLQYQIWNILMLLAWLETHG